VLLLGRLLLLLLGNRTNNFHNSRASSSWRCRPHHAGRQVCPCRRHCRSSSSRRSRSRSRSRSSSRSHSRSRSRSSRWRAAGGCDRRHGGGGGEVLTLHVVVRALIGGGDRQHRLLPRSRTRTQRPPESDSLQQCRKDSRGEARSGRPAGYRCASGSGPGDLPDRP
jgi:hypothetical protein